MKRLKSIVLSGLALVVTVAGLLMPAVPAAAADQSDTGGSAALSIPPKKTYLIEPGKSVQDKLTITNADTTNSLELSLRVIDFTYTDDGGTPKLFLDPNAPQTTWSIKPFIDIPETMSIPAGGTKSVDMGVAIPANQGAGSYYSAIIYSTGAPNGGNVGLSASGVTLVFVNVPGQVNENLTLQKFGAYRQQTSTVNAGYMFVTSDMPKTIGYTLKNAGNVTEAPAGTITYKWMFGQAKTIDDVNNVGSLALIGQTRTFTACIKTQAENVSLSGSQSTANVCVDPGLWPGYYSLGLDLFHGQNGNLTREVTGTAGFWYLPIWFIVVLIVVILALALFIWRTYTNVRSWRDGRHVRSMRRRKR